MPNIVWIILIFFIAIFIMDYIRNYGKNSIGECFWSSFLISFVFCIFLIIIICISAEYPIKTERVVWNTNEIYSLKEANSGVYGDFFLGSGSLGSEWYYVAYVKTTDGFYKSKFDQNIAFIKETNEISPRVEKYVDVTYHNKFVIFILGLETEVSNNYVKYILYVPKGTIIKEFHLE